MLYQLVISELDRALSVSIINLILHEEKQHAAHGDLVAVPQQLLSHGPRIHKSTVKTLQINDSERVVFPFDKAMMARQRVIFDTDAIRVAPAYRDFIFGQSEARSLNWTRDRNQFWRCSGHA
jgi:hypothetical protein